MVYNIEWANTNKLRGHPFVSENKLLPLIDLYIVVPSGATTIHISEVLADGIVFSVDNIPYAKSPVAHYTSIINRPNSIFKIGSTGELLPDAIGYLIADAEVAFPQEFASTETAIIPTLCIYENPGGVKRIFIRNTDGTLTKLKQNIIFEAGRNMVIDRDGNKIRFSNITTPDYSNYVKGLEIEGEVANDDGIFIFGRNIVKVRGVDFSTIIENADANCPTRFPDALRGGPGSDGDPGFTGQPGDPGLITCGGCGCFDCPCCGEEDLIFCCGEDDTCLEYDLDCCTPFTDINDLCCCPETEQCCIEGDFCPEGDFVNTNGGTAPKVGPPPNCILGDNAPPPPPPPPPPAGGPCPIDIDALNNFNEDISMTVSQQDFGGSFLRTSTRLSNGFLSGEPVVRFRVTTSPKLEEDTQLIVRLTVQIMPIGGDPSVDAFSRDFYFLDATVTSNAASLYTVQVFKPGANVPKDNLFTYMVDEDCKNCLFYSSFTTPTEFSTDPITKELFVIYENGDRFEIVNTRYSGWHQDGNDSQDVVTNIRPTVQIFDQDFEVKTNALPLVISTEDSSASFDTFHLEKATNRANGLGGLELWGLAAGCYGTTGGIITLAGTSTSEYRLNVFSGWFNDIDTDNTSVSIWDISPDTGNVWRELIPDSQAIGFVPEPDGSIFPSTIQFNNMHVFRGVCFISTTERLIADTLTITRVHKFEPRLMYEDTFTTLHTSFVQRSPSLYIDIATGQFIDNAISLTERERRYTLKTTQSLAATLDSVSSKIGYWYDNNEDCLLADRKMRTATSPNSFVIDSPSGGTLGITDVRIEFPIPCQGIPVTSAFTLDVPLVGNHGLVYGPDSRLVNDSQKDVYIRFEDLNVGSNRFSFLIDSPRDYARWDWDFNFVKIRAPRGFEIRKATGADKGFDLTKVNRVFLSMVTDPIQFGSTSTFDIALPGTPEFEVSSDTVVVNSGLSTEGLGITMGTVDATAITFPYPVFMNDRFFISKLQEFISGTLTREIIFTDNTPSDVGLSLNPETLSTSGISANGQDYTGSSALEVVIDATGVGRYDGDTPANGNPNIIYNPNGSETSTHILRLRNTSPTTLTFDYQKSTFDTTVYVRNPVGTWNKISAVVNNNFPNSVTLSIP